MRPDHITELARKYVDYDMISTHTELPDFPVPRVRLLYTFLNHREQYPRQLTEAGPLAAFLVELGLDTHDTIDVEDRQKEEKEMRSRQLKVLAGDYFSSVFYQLLAHSGQIRLVNSMSAAVCEVNRLKVRLYNSLKRMLLPAETYVKERVELKKTLFLSFSQQMDKSMRNMWDLLLEELSHCEVVMEEIKQSMSSPAERKGFAYLRMFESATAEDKERISRGGLEAAEWQQLLAKYTIKEQLLTMLGHSADKVEQLIEECQGDKLRAELAAVLEPVRLALAPEQQMMQKG